MTEVTKLNLLGWTATALVAAALAWNAVGESLLRDVLQGMQRKAYYEQVIEPRGLSLREGEFWEPASRKPEGRDSHKPE